MDGDLCRSRIIFLKRIAGPSLRPRIPVRWSSVSTSSADPSML